MLPEPQNLAVRGPASGRRGHWGVAALPLFITRNILGIYVVDGANGSGGPAKPGSAGSSQREASMRVLQLCQKSEWPPMDQVLKGMEKTVASAGEDVNTTPLAGIMDVVSQFTGYNQNKDNPSMTEL